MGTKKRSAADEAAKYLEHRMRTVYEVERHLKDKGYCEDEISETIEDLISLRYLDDYRYAVLYYEHGYEKRRGSQRMKRELAERGVDEDVIENAYQDYIYENKVDEFQNAMHVIERDMENRAVTTVDERYAGRIARKLEQMGYGGNVIFKVMENVRTGTAREE